MNNFKNHLEEMATLNSLGQKGSSREHEWDNRDEKFVELLYDKLPENLKVFKYSNMYFLTQNNKYIGFIEINNNVISKSHRKPNNIKRGFYQIMLPLLVNKLGTLYSDDSLSKSAINAYEKLSKSRTINITVNGKPFDKDELLSHSKTRVQISEGYNGGLKDVLDMHYEKISKDRPLGDKMIPGDWKQMLIENDPMLWSLSFDLEYLI